MILRTFCQLHIRNPLTVFNIKFCPYEKATFDSNRKKNRQLRNLKIEREKWSFSAKKLSLSSITKNYLRYLKNI